MRGKSLPGYVERVQEFRKVRLRVLNIIYEASPAPLTAEQILMRYIQRYRHAPRIRNRLRELRKEGLVESRPNGKRLLWSLKGEWKTK